MTEPTDDHSDKDMLPSGDQPEANKPEAEKAAAAPDAGKALAPAASSPVNPFLAAASEAEDKVGAPIPPRSLASRMLDYSAHAAIIVGLIGFAWTVSGHVVNRSAGDQAKPVAAASLPTPAPKADDDVAQLRTANLKMHEEIKALKASVDTLRTAMRRDTTSEQVRMLSAGLDTVKGNIGTMRSETSSAIAQLSGKVDKLQPGKVRDLNDRLGRLEHQATTDNTATGSIGKTESRHADSGREDVAKSVPPEPPAKPTKLASAEEPQAAKSDDKPQVISGFVVRDVYQGVALIESRRGSMEVVPGVAIPGAGVVKSIDRKGGTWTVTTSKGQIAYLAPTPHTNRQPQQNPYGYGRGGYAPYRYGY